MLPWESSSGKHLSEVQQTGFRRKTSVVAYIGFIIFEGEVLEMLSARGCPLQCLCVEIKVVDKVVLDECGDQSSGQSGAWGSK